MKRIKRILIGLDFTKSDKDVIKAADTICKKNNIEMSVFSSFSNNETTHRKLSLDTSEYKELSIEKAIEKKNIEKVKKYSKISKSKFIVEKIDPKIGFKKITASYDIDLLVLGRKKNMNINEIFPYESSEDLDFSILLVPNKRKFQVNKIMIPYDFSEYSHKILDYIMLNFNSKKTEILLVNVFKLSEGFYSAGKTEKEAIAIKKKEIKNKFYKLNLNKSITFKAIWKSDLKVSQILYTKALENKIDFISINTSNKSIINKYLFGSVSQNLIKINRTIPMLILA